MGRVTTVVDRNGEVVPFRRSRVVRAILAAVRNAGSDDEWVADKLADMVVYFLDATHGGRPVPPTADDVDDMIEKALLSTPDLAGVTQAFLASRRQREELHQIEQSARAATPGPEVAQSAQHVQGWNRARITAALVREQGMDSARAAEVALAVEQRVLALGLPRLSTGLIRELADVELIARGLASQPAMLGVPRYDIEQWLFPSDEDTAAATQGELAWRAGRRILADFTLSGVLGEAARELHLGARVVLDALEAPAAIACLRLDAAACLEAGAGLGMLRHYTSPAQGLTGAFARLASLLRDAAAITSGPVAIRGLDTALMRSAEPDRAALQDGLRLLAAQGTGVLTLQVGPSTGPERDLVIRAWLDALAADSSLRGRVLLELAVSPGAFADPARRALVERAAAAACACGQPLFRLRDDATVSARGLFGDAPGPRHGAVLARASINLAGAALAQPTLPGTLAALDGLVEGAVDGLAARAKFLERVSMRALADPVPPAARMLRALVGGARDVELAPVGLHTAASLVAGPEGGARDRAAQQILSYLEFRFRDAAGRHTLRGVLGDFETDAPARMARSDIAALARNDPDSPLRVRLAEAGAYLPGAAMPADLPVQARLGAEAALHGALGRDATLTVGPDEHLDAAAVTALLRSMLAEGAPRPARFCLAVRHRVCRDCGSAAPATVEACPACGSTAWALPPGQKSLFDA